MKRYEWIVTESEDAHGEFAKLSEQGWRVVHIDKLRTPPELDQYTGLATIGRTIYQFFCQKEEECTPSETWQSY